MITENKWDTAGPFLRWFVCYGKGVNHVEKLPGLGAANARVKEINAGLQNTVDYVLNFGTYYQLGWHHIDYEYQFFDTQVLAKDFCYWKEKEGYKIYAIARQAPKDHLYWRSWVARGGPLGWNLLKPGEWHPKPKPTDRASIMGKFQDAAGWDP